MKILSPFEKARNYFEAHSQEDAKAFAKRTNPGPTITISRQTGIGATAICERLIKNLNFHAKEYYDDWTFFDRDLINKIMEDHKMPTHFRKFLEEEKIPKIDAWFNEILGLTPSKLALLNKTKKTIEKLHEYGNSIIVGRGANIILQNHERTFHIRLVASVNHRIETAMDLYKLDHRTASNFILQEDESRTNYLWKYFHKNINDPLLYHAVVNTTIMNFEEIADTIAHCVQKRFPQFFIEPIAAEMFV